MTKLLEKPKKTKGSLVDRIFAPKGWLQKTLGLEHRPQQEAMAKAVEKALKYDAPLLFEAGTGVGKSLAYLIPGIIFGIEEKRPFIVSTHTKALQEQIQNNDLARCRELFEAVPELEKFAEFKTAMLMGRSNYLCTTRLAHVINARTELFPSNLQNELERIVEWSSITESGIVEEMPTAPSPDVWEMVNADSTSCNPKNCKGNDCFFQRAKAQIRKSNLIIVNHSLLFSLISSGNVPKNQTPGILFPEDFLVLDEAHTVPDIATDHFGARISSYSLDRALKILYNPKTRKGLLAQYGKQADCTLVVQALSAAEEFFNLIRQQHLQRQEATRLLESPWTEPLICESLKILIERLTILVTEHSSDLIKANLNDQKNRIQAYYISVQKALVLEPKDHVHWVEKSGRVGHLTTIQTAPINVAPYLGEAIFHRHTSAILTSATLATGNSLENFRSRTGAENVEGLIENSPFDYEKNTQIFIVKDAPEPVQGNLEEYRKFLVKAVIDSIPKTDGGTLVLFTSYADMNSVAEGIKEDVLEMGRTLWIQGQDLSRTQLIDVFKEVGNGVLLGTDSYWTGIDVPGAALSHVIITRIPFENPSHPIKQAQSEWLKKEGQHPFMHLTLPEAVIKFRQGLGRLIRNKTDSGIITILDSRILNKSYGKTFIEALPKKEFEIFK